MRDIRKTMTAKGAALACALAACGAPDLTRADQLHAVDTIGNAHKSVGLLSHYTVNAETHSLDVIAAVPAVSTLSKDVERKLAGDTAREMCGEGTAQGISGWTVRMFMPGESTPASTCRMGH